MAPGKGTAPTTTAESGQCLQVEVVQSLGPRQTRSVVLSLPTGSTVADALQATHWLQSDFTEQIERPLLVGVWGRQACLTHLLRQGDRVELYRPLQVDPKEARRLRYAARGAKPKRVSGS